VLKVGSFGNTRHVPPIDGFTSKHPYISPFITLVNSQNISDVKVANLYQLSGAEHKYGYQIVNCLYFQTYGMGPNLHNFYCHGFQQQSGNP
jgi:hypothetical protein